MAYDRTNKKYICDYCGNVMHLYSNEWHVSNSRAKCPMCIKKEKLMKEQSKYLKRQSREPRSYSYDRGSWKDDITFWTVVKWLLSPYWAGPYLLYVGIKYRRRFWLGIGIEATLLFPILILLLNLVPQMTDYDHPMYNITGYIFLGLCLINVVLLVVYWIRLKEYDEDN